MLCWPYCCLIKSLLPWCTWREKGAPGGAGHPALERRVSQLRRLAARTLATCPRWALPARTLAFSLQALPSRKLIWLAWISKKLFDRWKCLSLTFPGEADSLLVCGLPHQRRCLAVCKCFSLLHEPFVSAVL